MWSHDLKLQRALQYLKQLEAEVRKWDAGYGYSISVSPDPQPPNFIVRAENIRGPDDSLALLIGDCLSNARSALDYIAHTLGDAGAGGEMGAEDSERSSFPIIGDVDKAGFSGTGSERFDRAAERMLATVTDDARAAIKQLQPFSEGDIWEYDGLWVLHELARIDRHRFLHFGVVRADGLELDRAKSRNVKLKNIDVDRGTVWPELEDSADLARIEAYPANPDEEMVMRFTGGLAITLDTQDTNVPAVHGHEVDLTISSAIRAVASALRQLQPYLPN